uniref:OSJNBb0065J09.2 protein n=2 Tax=Oryza sativa TaxID=4530 RepID=Q7XKG7_ORYSJ|nr:OSJNBb0065J09.2 [Oryza sativa Japonica Group]CAH67873.1 OSIGBa0153E02-OSIGBa0093I20.2 [Oryza sativa]
MASTAEVAAAAASASAAAAAAETKGKGEEGKRKGMGDTGDDLAGSVFAGRGDDYERWLQYLSKEEAAVHARLRRSPAVASATSSSSPSSARQSFCLVSQEVHCSFITHSSVKIFKHGLGDTKLEQKDQKLLERLREERKAKIDELKERTNYYLTQKLIQKYDLDPAAKAAAASVLATKLGADSGRREYVKDEAKSESSQARSSASEVIPSNGLRNRKHTKAKGSSTGNAADDHNTGQVSEAVGDHLEAMEPSRVVGHYQSSGLARKEDFPHVTYCCPHCHALNMSNQTIGRWSGSNSGQLTSSAQVSGTNPVADNELGNQTEGQEIYVEENSGEGQGIYVEANSG